MGELIIGKHVCVQKPISVEDIKFDTDENGDTLYVNAAGERITKVQISKSEFKWIRQDMQEEKGKSYKSMNGKPVATFKKTKNVQKYSTVDENEVRFAIESDTYVLHSDGLKSELQQLGKGKAIAFKYANSGFKIYKAVVFFDEILGQILMKCIRGDLRKIDFSMPAEEIKAKDDVASLDLDAIQI